MIDYLIIGAGLAGISFAETALNNGKTIYVFDDHKQGSSKTAAGIYNPVILKRFSGLANAQQQLDQLAEFHANLNVSKNIDVIKPIPILRKFASYEEQNNWFIAADKKELSPFLSTELLRQKYDGIISDFDFGEVLQTGYVDTETLLDKYHAYLNSINVFSKDKFHSSYLELFDDYVQYKNVKARHIIFADGYGLHTNAFFDYLPLDGTKGEILVIKSASLKVDAIIKAGVFILPIGNDLFKVGATYNWDDKTEAPTESGKQELLEKIREMLNCDFEVIEHKAGIRPTVKDRKPLIGTHPDYKTIHVLNGLGTRGVMLGPAMAKILYEHIENNIPIDKDISIDRYVTLYWKQQSDRNS